MRIRDDGMPLAHVAFAVEGKTLGMINNIKVSGVTRPRAD